MLIDKIVESVPWQMIHDLSKHKLLSVHDHVDHNDTLEAVIAKSGGNTDRNYRVIKDGQEIGFVNMKDLVRALVPRVVGEVDHPGVM